MTPAHTRDNVVELRKSEARVPPNDQTAEACVISACILAPLAYATVSSFLRPKHFFSQKHRSIFEAIRALSDAHVPIDTVTIGTWLKDRDRLDAIGGLVAITELLDATPAVSNIGAHARIVFDKWRVRTLVTTCQSAAARGYFDYGDAQAFIDEHAHAAAELARLSSQTSLETNLEALRRLVKELSERSHKPLDGNRRAGIQTGLWGYDAITHGLHASNKVTIVALPGRGKTALAMQWAVHVAKQGIGVLVFSTEQTREEILLRMLAHEANVDGKRLKVPQISPAEWTRVYDALATLEKLPLIIDDTSDLDVDQIRSRTLQAVDRFRVGEKVPLGLVVVDYVQRLRPVTNLIRADKHHQIAHSTRALKQLAKELKVPVLELAQETASEIDKVSKLRPRPDVGWTADCKTIGKESDVVLFLRRNPMRNREGKLTGGEDATNVTMIIAKQRDGEEGDIALRFKREWLRFEHVVVEDQRE